ncbi:hypothetical protein Tsubulata_030717 [Turnera subulata]|uniref:PTC1-like winged helix-turn-helix domain-containing protein n=1 Tax=Turnera subulata TaxID=218843 RepID=A0A9Q0FZE9_9ROSI|nr:hypothetical protein Tsubulata_030717 [Turnera subulata]
MNVRFSDHSLPPPVPMLILMTALPLLCSARFTTLFFPSQLLPTLLKPASVMMKQQRKGLMVKWGSCRQAEFIAESKENNLQLTSTVVKQDEANAFQLPSSTVKEEQDEEGMETESVLIPHIEKSNRFTLGHLTEAGTKRRIDQKKHDMPDNCKKIKHESSTPRRREKNRWGLDRYKLAEKHMLQVMKSEGAVFENPITRPALRTAARKYIGDTGLLDHLLKHIDGKVAPGGAERFRRCYNTEGIMEYWLESADLVMIKREAGVPNPNWVPPPCWRTGSLSLGDSVSAEELASFKEEIVKLKRDMEELACKNQEQGQANQIGEMYRELVRWRGKTDERLTEISSSLSGLQNMYRESVAWKAKIEQQLTEVANSLSSIQASKQCTNLTPTSDRWEDWLEAGTLDNLQGEEFTPWLEGTELVNVRRDALVQEPYSASQPWPKLCDTPLQDGPVCARDLELLKEEMAKMKRDVQQLAPKRLEDDQANWTPDSSTTANSKFELNSSFLLFQEMFKELTKWKAKIEQQVLEISNSVSGLQGSKPGTI